MLDHQHKTFSNTSLFTQDKITAVSPKAPKLHHLPCHVSHQEIFHHLFRHDSIIWFAVMPASERHTCITLSHYASYICYWQLQHTARL